MIDPIIFQSEIAARRDLERWPWRGRRWSAPKLRGLFRF